MSDKIVLKRAGEGESLRVLADTIVCKQTDKALNADWSLFEMTVPEQSGPPLHSHPWDEAYYLLSGELAFEVDGVPYRLQAGDYLNIAAGTPHTLVGMSQTPTRVLVWASPGGMESFFRELHTEIKAMPEDLPKVLDIAAKHCLSVVAPAG